MAKPKATKSKAKQAALDDIENKLEENPSSEAIAVGATILVKDYAEKLNVPVTDLISTLIQNGFMVNMNQDIDFETAELIAQEYEKTVVLDEASDKAKGSRLTGRDLKELTKEKTDDVEVTDRPPVVIVMGHVDHGKTTLLDALRQTDEATQEAGNITQHIGAYQVQRDGKTITFMDTPGHEAFIEMRQKGADITDVAVLVVAANDGVQPQTVEAMNHAKAAEVPIIVALNKIDLPDAKPDQVKTELAEIGLNPEEWGGDTVFVEVSAKEGTGIKELEETILLVADVQELKANPNRKAIGYVIEANMSPKGGPVATAIIKTGTLNTGDAIAVGDAYGSVRSMTNYLGEEIKEAGPSMPVQIMGLNKVPMAGDVLQEVATRAEAREQADKVNTEEKARRLRKKVEAEQKDREKKLHMIIKGDVQGSVDAIVQSIEPLKIDDYSVDVVKAAAGEVNDSDVMLAASTNAWIVGFNIKASANAEKMAEREEVEIGSYNVIYDLIEQVKKRIVGLVGPEIVRNDLGKLKVLAIFRTTRGEMIVGGKVNKGLIKKKAQVEVMRDGEMVGEGVIDELQHNKEQADEVKSGNECGITFKGNIKIKEGDELIAYETEEKARTFDEAK